MHYDALAHRAHATHKKLTYLGSLFSGCGPAGLPPVPSTEKTIESRNFSPDAEVIADAETWLGGQNPDFS